MTAPVPTRATTSPGFRLLLSVLLPLLGLAKLGQDGNWDLRNYHLYNAHAWWHGRYAQDIAPAQMQSWHNPLLDMPAYLLNQAGSPGLVVSLWLVLPTMVAIYLLLRLLPVLAPRISGPVATTVLAGMAISGVATLAEVGTTLNDAFVAAGILGSLFLILGTPANQLSSRHWFGAGLLAGATAGLKLTAASYCLGLPAAALAMGFRRPASCRLGFLLLGGLLGISVTYGNWGWNLWQQHGNPFFPYFNQWFLSPDALASGYADQRFRPTSLWQAVLAPLHLAFDSQRFSEMPLRDPRLLMGVIGFGLAPWLVRASKLTDAEDSGPRWRALAAFYFVALMSWSMQSGVYRYALGLELLACLGWVCLLQFLPGRWHVTALAASLVLAVVGSNHTHWGRQPFGPPLASVHTPPIPGGSLVVVSSQAPLAFAVIGFPDDVPVVAIHNNLMDPGQCTGLQRRASELILGHARPMWLLRNNDDAAAAEGSVALGRYGLAAHGACLPLRSNLDELKLCPLVREKAAPPCDHSSALPGR